METKKVFLARGKLKVTARGYWFSAGGTKGSFGFYPHLKNARKQPVYPDTQVHGDLRMAARWLADLDDTIKDDLIDQIFGFRGKPETASLKVTDLEPATADQRIEFTLVPRISVNEVNRTVDEHMLASFECAWLEGHELSCDIWLGPFRDEKILANAKILVENSAEFLSGFGAWRSRGYGRGTVKIEWLETLPLPAKTSDNPPTAFLYRITALVNMRNRPVDPGRSQLVPTHALVTSDQLRSWFSRTYHMCYGVWPDLEELAQITFPDMYQAPATPGQQAYPAPMSVLTDSDGKVWDTWGRKSGEEPEDGKLMRTKSKPAEPGSCVTQETPPRLIRTDRLRRMRNVIGPDFLTLKEDGLFVQEYIPKGTPFAGLVTFADPKSDFSAKAWSIFKTVYPLINGTLFTPETVIPNGKAVEGPGPHLVVSPIVLDPSRSGPNNRITISTVRAYNTMLRRPRRNRIVISPGSILTEPEPGKTFPWIGFGNDLIPLGKPPVDRQQPPRDIIESSSYTISRAQAGQLREFLNPHFPEAAMGQLIADRLEKFRRKNNEVMVRIYEGMQASFTGQAGRPDPAAVRTFVRSELDRIYAKQARGD